MARSALLLPLTCLLLPPFSAAQSAEIRPAIHGYVTRAASPTDFDVEGTHIRIDANTEFGLQVHERPGREIHSSRTPLPTYLGLPVDIYGKADGKSHSVLARMVVIHPPAAAPVSGTGIIDFIPSSRSIGTTGDRIVRADGYLLRITPQTTLTFNAPLTPSDPLTTNLWITYHGLQQTDGTVLVDKASVRRNIVTKTEKSLRTLDEYDPAAVDPDAHQNRLSQAFLGTDVQKIPPYDDPALQERVHRIGAALVPAYQRNLPDTDPTRINFRFEVIDIDAPRWHDAVSLTSGIILVPYTLIQRLKDDAQLATVLADNIAEVLEKQALRNVSASDKMLLSEVASLAVPIPGLFFATDAANVEISEKILTAEHQQSGRVSLFLLHDAGYDITEAPRTWWLLAPRKPTPLDKVQPPPRSVNLYINLGTTWRNALPSPPTATAGNTEVTSTAHPSR